MAINDNTSYELTGAQVKDLANKIKGKAADNIFVGATSSAPGSKGLVPQPQAGDDTKILAGDGTWKALANIVYPVGSIYMSATLSTAAQVEAAIGGTWVAWGAGRVPVGVDTSDADFDTAEETGGEKTHTLTTTEIPSHNHKDLNWTDDSYHASLDSGSGNGVKLSYSGNSIVYNDGNFRTGYTGGSAAHNNVQPYITCYMYKRTA